MKPQFNFTLDQNKIIGDPKGWDEIELVLNRHDTYYSLIEEVGLKLEFWGNNSGYDGGYEYIKQKRDAGVDSQCTIEVEISWDGGDTWEYFWDGVLDLTELIEIEHLRRFQCTLMRNSKWSKFINRKAVPVNIQDTQTVDGAPANDFIATARDLTLPPQPIRQTYDALHSGDVLYTLPANGYGVIDFLEVSGFSGSQYLSEIGEKFDYPRVDSSVLPFEMFALAYAGSYQITGTLYIASAAFFPSSQVNNIEVYTQINSDTPLLWLKTQEGTNPTTGRTKFTYSATLQLQKGDFIRIYFRNTQPSLPQSFYWIDFTTSGLTVIGDTEFPQSVAPGFFIHDVARSIVGHTVGEEYFYSEYFGGQGTDLYYGEDGCGAYFRLLQGLNIRGKAIADKPFSMSFDDWWEGIDPIFNIGLGYENVEGEEVIRVEKKSHFFDSTSSSVDLEYVNNIEISYDPDFLITSLEIGYLKWQGEVSSGIDDPQTVHTYASRLKTVGAKTKKNKRLLSSLVAASLVIEQTRRQSVELNKDWKFDEDKFIIQTTSSISPEEVRLYSNQNITNLIRAEARYNIRLTPASNFNRWQSFLFIAFQNYVGDVFRFTEGQGNTRMIYDDPINHEFDPGVYCSLQMDAGKYANESGDIPIDDVFLFLPIVYKFTHPLTWEEYISIRDNRNQSITLTYNDNTGSLKKIRAFIKTLTYKLNEAKAEMQVWMREFMDPNPTVTLFAYMNPAVGQWQAGFNVVVSPLVLTGPTGSGTQTDPGTGTVEVYCSKQSNGAIAQGNGSVKYYKNGNLEPGTGAIGSLQGTQTFVTGGNVGGGGYQYTGVVLGDVLTIEIQEI